MKDAVGQRFRSEHSELSFRHYAHVNIGSNQVIIMLASPSTSQHLWHDVHS